MSTKIVDLKSYIEQRVIRVPIAGCWIWICGTRNTGYPSLNVIDIPERTGHRFSWVVHNGPIPKGLHVLHKCDNRLCMNPHHLFLGTNTENSLDCQLKGRQFIPLGEHNGRAKLTAKQVLAIRKDNRPTKEIAAQYNVLVRQINLIKKRQTWRHL